MPATMPHAAPATPRELPEIDPVRVRVPIRNAENAVGQCIDRARQLLGWSLKELAAALLRDERQVARWISGAEHPQLDALFAVPTLRAPLVIALAERTAEVEVVTEIRLSRRIA